MFSKRSQEGWLMIDNRASGEGMVESATITCSHCQTVVVLNPLRTRERGYCRKCDHYICDNPACHFECVPINKVFDDLQQLAVKNG
jgi:uncharacterized paraquat-inducible protein A